MSSPRSIGSASPNLSREGTRIVLREITTSLNNSAPLERFKTAKSTVSKSGSHDFTAEFAREFVEVPAESLSTASSFHSISSTQGTKRTCGLTPDSSPNTPVSTDVSYVNSTIPGLDDFINRIDADLKVDHNLSHYESFIDEQTNVNEDLKEGEFALNNKTLDDNQKKISDNSSADANSIALSDTLTLSAAGLLDSTTEISLSSCESVSTLVNLNKFQEKDITYVQETLLNAVIKSDSNTEFQSLKTEIEIKQPEVITTVSEIVENVPVALNVTIDVGNKADDNKVENSAIHTESLNDKQLGETIKDIDKSCQDNCTENITQDICNDKAPIKESDASLNQTVSLEYIPLEVKLEDKAPNNKDTEVLSASLNQTVSIEQISLKTDAEPLNPFEEIPESNFAEEVNNKEDSLFETEILDTTISLDNSVENECEDDLDFETFKPQKHSTSLNSLHAVNSEKVAQVAQTVADEILNSSLQASEDIERFVTATDEIFQDPRSFDYFLNKPTTVTNKRLESLYIKFDPLASRQSMLPQSNVAENEDHNEDHQKEKNASQTETIETPPKRFPAIAALDKLISCSPMNSPTVDNAKGSETNKDSKASVPIVDENMAKELELVRATILQLEEKVAQEKKQRLKAEEDNRKMMVVVDEYEQSMSQLIAKTEVSRGTLEKEKEKLYEELQAANHHLSNTEAAFNDVHQKYERLKSVVQALKSNENVLKESIQENEQTIAGLVRRYDTLKSHAMAQLEKANLELENIRKQNEAETVRLKAMVRKAELKSNSLQESVEQKTKENKELTKILDEVIARVGADNR